MACDNPIIQALTAEDFKTQFYRDFNYIDTWLVGTTYNIGDKVFYDVNRKFYQCLNNGVVGTVPTDIANWKKIPNEGLISDLDITNAYEEACVNFNDTIFDSDDIVLAYLYLSAHYLVHDLNAGGQNGGGSVGIGNSRSVGNVSESYSIPDVYLKEPFAAFLSKSSYGVKYYSMVHLRSLGNMVTVRGETTA